ncbi:MAG: amino acid permease [Mycobacteriaceae bacterium]|nr:amino acid permease [Mycobacteriaceae bacterium]
MVTARPPADQAAPDGEDDGYHKALRPHQVQMIAIGGVISTGLFLGTGGRLASAGPGLFLAYALCGVFVFFIMRALGELVLYRPTSGSFVSYAREFYGEKLAFAVGWLFYFRWSTSSIAQISAIAAYVQYWDPAEAVPHWLTALIALVLVVCMNLASVKWFGELEFWTAMIKVVALVTFLVVGTVVLVGRFQVAGHSTGIGMVADNGGLFPTGLSSFVFVITGAVYSYGATELVGTAAGETSDPERTMPRAINAVIGRIALFYVGSLLLLGLLLPYTAFKQGESPFVTFFGRLGVGGAGSIMSLVMVTAALSCLNAGLYATGRSLRSMAVSGSAPAIAARMSKGGVPYVGILATAGLALVGVGLNAVVPQQAYEIVLNMSALSVIAVWAVILACQLRLWSRWRRGQAQRASFRLVGTPYTAVATLVFLLAIIVLMVAGGTAAQRGALVAMCVVMTPALIGGWFLRRRFGSPSPE